MKHAQEARKKRILITADSAADLTPEWIRAYDIRVIRHRLHTDAGVFEDATEIDSDELCCYMQDGAKTARSQVPDAAAFERFFAEQLEDAESIFHISISHQASPVYGEAKGAEGAFENVRVFNSGNMAGGAGVFALYAARLAEQGRSMEEIADTLMNFKRELRSVYVLSSSDYLRRGGRMTPLLSKLLTAFLLHPVIIMKNDRMNFRFVWSSRYRKNFIRRALKNVARIDPSLLIVPHSACFEEELRWIREEVERYFHFERVICLPTSSAVTVNVGPGTFGLVFRVIPPGEKKTRLFNFLPGQKEEMTR